MQVVSTLPQDRYQIQLLSIYLWRAGVSMARTEHRHRM